MTNKVNMTTVNQDMTTNSNRHGSKPAENSIKKALKLFSTNGAGIIYGKVDSLKHEVKATCATVVTVQETHCKRKGRIQLEGMVVFEAIRAKKGGGTMCAVDESLNPKLVEEHNDPFEILVVEIDGQKRIITGYGPQENWTEERRMPFFVTLEAEIVKAAMAGKSVIVELDANSKLGPENIPGDPHGITPNGRILEGIIVRQNLSVVNASTKTKGRITRKRTTQNKVEESIIDFVLVSKDLDEQIECMEIDEDRKHVLSRVRRTKKGITHKESDHHVMLTTFKQTVDTSKKKEKTEIYNLKNKECQRAFKKYTSNTKMLSSVIDSNEDINTITRRLIKKINGCIAMIFKKVRITQHKTSKSERLHDKIRKLKGLIDEESKDALDKVVEELAEHEQEKYEEVLEELKKTNHEDKLDTQQFWKIRKKVSPTNKDPPSVMMDSHGNILTSNKAISDRALEVYVDRLKGNKMKPHLIQMEEEVNQLCEKRLEETKLNKTKPWNMNDLDEAIKSLDRNKSRDAIGMANELLKEEAAGSDFKLAILKLMNLIKDRLEFPEALELCNITSLYKHKGSHKDFNNYRGVFRVCVFRSILDRLMYNDNYHIVDENLTDGNVGARKGRNVRDNIFVLGAIVNSVINGKMPPIQISVTDVEKCFDKMWLQATINALYEAGITNDTLNLLYLENKNAQIAIKVNNKLTKRVLVKDVVMQGSVWEA